MAWTWGRQDGNVDRRWTAPLAALSVWLAADAVAAQPAPPAAEPQPSAASDEPIVDLTGAAPLGPPADAAQPPAAPPPPPVVPAGPPPPPPEEDEEEGDPLDGGQRYTGFGPRIGTFWGFGVGARTGHPHIGFDASGGWKPVLVTLQHSDTEAEVDGFHSWQLNGHLYATFNPGSKFVAGATAGYRYNSLLRHGVAVGFDGVLNLGAHLGLQFNFGPSFYPDGPDRVREAGGYAPDQEFGFPGPGVLVALGIGLMIYP